MATPEHTPGGMHSVNPAWGNRRHQLTGRGRAGDVIDWLTPEAVGKVEVASPVGGTPRVSRFKWVFLGRASCKLQCQWTRGQQFSTAGEVAFLLCHFFICVHHVAAATRETLVISLALKCASLFFFTAWLAVGPASNSRLGWSRLESKAP